MGLIRICQVTSVHKATDGRIFERECTSLAKLYDVTLIAPNVEDYEKNGVHINGVTLPRNKFKRILHLNRVFDKMVEVDADVYHFHDPELIPLGLRIKKRGKLIIFDSHENHPAQISKKPFIPKPFKTLAYRVYERYERRVLKQYDALVSVTPEIVERLRKINPNTIMLTNFPICKIAEDKRTWQRKIGFAGAINEGWKIHHIIEAIKDLDVTFELAGPVRSEYKQQLESLAGWKHVNYHGVLPHQDVLNMLQCCSVGMAVSTDSNPNIGMKNGSIGVTKLFEYMGLGLPVIATDLTIWKPIVVDNNCGFCVDCNDVDGITKYISFFLDNPKIAKEYGDKAKAIALEKYSWQTQEGTLFELYSSLT